MDRSDRRSAERERSPRPPTGGGAARPAGTSGLVYAGLGVQFAVTLVLASFLGSWLDRRFGTQPVLLLACVVLGGGGAFYALYRQLTRAQQRSAAGRKAGGPEAP